MLFDQTRRFSVGNKKSKKSHKSLDLWDLTVHYLVSSAERAAPEPTLSENIIKLQITDNHILSTMQSKSKSF